MADVIAFKFGTVKAVLRDEPDIIAKLALLADLCEVSYLTADSAQVDNLADLFRGL